jgi:hypothetical protein
MKHKRHTQLRWGQVALIIFFQTRPYKRKTKTSVKMYGFVFGKSFFGILRRCAPLEVIATGSRQKKRLND